MSTRNILLDVVNFDPIYGEWSADQLDRAGLRGNVFINDIVYAEFSARYASPQEVDETLRGMDVRRRAAPASALFLAGRAFVQYRRRGGPRTSLLPDFFIGAQAAVEGLTLLTRDAGRYRSYFPNLHIIGPHQ